MNRNLLALLPLACAFLGTSQALAQSSLKSQDRAFTGADIVSTRDVNASATGGGSLGSSTGATASGSPTAPPFDGALYLPFDGTASPGEIVTKPGATPPTFVPGKYGQAIYFNDSSAVAVPFELSPIDTPQITLTAWIKRSPDSSMGKIVSSAGIGHPVMQIYGGSVKQLRGSGGREAFSMSVDGFDIKTDQWTFIAIVLDYELKTIRLQVDDSEPQILDRRRDGKPLRMEPNSWDVREQTILVGPDGKKGYYVTIGATEFSRFGGVARGYAIDDVRIYTRALSEQTIAGLAGDRMAPDTAPSRYADIPVLGAPVRDLSPPDELAKRNSSATNRIDIPLENRPPSPADILNAARRDDDGITLLEVPIGTGPGAYNGELNPDLIAPTDSPAQRLQDDLRKIRESTPPVPSPSPAFTCDNPGNGNVLATRFGVLPEKFAAALKQASDCRLAITAVALNNSAQWVISTRQQIAYSRNLPAGMAMRIREHKQRGRGLDAVDLANDGTWVVVSGTNFAQSGLTSSALNRIRGAAISGSVRVSSVSFHPIDSATWLMVDSDGVVSGANIPPGLLKAVADALTADRVIHQVRYTPDGGWVLLASDLWFATDGVTNSVVSNLDSIRRQNRRADHIVFYVSQSRFAVVSNGQEPMRGNDPVWQVENGLAGGNIWARMRANRVTGLSIAMIQNNRIVWARGYGQRKANDPESYVFTDTIFDAASISKPIAAFGVLQLVQAGKMDLKEEGVLQDLEGLFSRSQRRKFRDAIRPEVGNLIQVLQHCASFCYANTPNCTGGGNGGGAARYSTNVALPPPREIILGIGLAKSWSGWRLLRTGNNGLSQAYTSGNYMLVQALIDIHGGGFLSHMGALFVDLGMASTTYRTPFAGRNGDRFAHGHVAGITQPIYAYPEMAAASLTTTPIDVAKFVIAVNRNGQAPSKSLLPKERVDQFLGKDTSVMQYCDEPGNMALGINYTATANGWGGNELFWHGGSHNGYKTWMVGLPGRSSGIVVFMTGSNIALTNQNSIGPNTLFAEIRRSVVSVYGL